MISKTLKALLDYVRSDINGFSPEGAMKSLTPIYNYNLNTISVARIVLKAYSEALDEKRFEMPDKNLANEKVIFSLVDYTLTLKSESTVVTLKEVYGTMIMQVLRELYLARVDWLHNQNTI